MIGATVGILAVWLLIFVLPTMYYRADNTRKQIRFWSRNGRRCRHRVSIHDPHHRPDPLWAWTDWTRLRGRREWRECFRCGVEQRRDFTGRTWLERRKWRRECFHHEIGGNPANTRPAVSWIRQELIDVGRRKRWWCDERQGGCDRQWIT